MSEYLHDRDRQAHDDRVNWMTVLFTLCIGAPSLVIGFLNINIQGVTTGTDGLTLGSAFALVLGCATALATVFLLVWWLVIGRHLRRTRPSGSPRTPR